MRFAAFCALLAVLAAARAACDCTPDPTCFVITCPTLSIGSHSSVVILFGSLDVSSAAANPAFPSLVKITGSLTMAMNSLATALSLPQLIWIGDSSLSIGDLSVWSNPALTSISLPRLTDIYGQYFVSGDANLTTLSLPLLTNVQAAPLTHAGTAVCNYCSLCALAAAKPSLSVSTNTSSPLNPWSVFSATCNATCDTCPPPPSASPSPSPSASQSPTASPTTSASPTSSPTRSASPTASPTTTATPSASAAPTCPQSNYSFHWDPACGNSTTLPDLGSSGLTTGSLFTTGASYGTWSAPPCAFLRSQYPWFSSIPDRSLAIALTTVPPTGGLTVMFWLRTAGATSNFQSIMSTRLTINGATPQIEGSLKGWNIYINTNYSTNPAWYSEGNGPYLGWLSFWWSQCGNVTILSNPITHGWRKFHILNLNGNTTNPYLNTPFHVAIVYSNLLRSITAYINGSPVASISNSTMGYWPSICPILPTDPPSSNPSLRLGQNNENVLYPLSADLGSLSIHNAALAPGDITSASSTC